MPEYEPDDDRELRSAFESFRTDALNAVTPPGTDAVRAAARHRHHTRIALTSGFAVVVLIAAVGVGLLLTHRVPTGGQVTAASSQSEHPSHRPPRSSAPHASASPSPGDTHSGQSGNPDGGQGQPPITVAVAADPLPLDARSSGAYHAGLGFSVHNTGKRTIVTGTVTITGPAGVSYQDERCDGNTCPLTEVKTGTSAEFSGTLSYSGDPDAGSGPPVVTITVTGQNREGVDLAPASASFTLTLPGGASQAPGDGGSASPSAPPSSPDPSSAPPAN